VALALGVLIFIMGAAVGVLAGHRGAPWSPAGAVRFRGGEVSLGLRFRDEGKSKVGPAGTQLWGVGCITLEPRGCWWRCGAPRRGRGAAF
jgi:hypothetical protein